MIKLIKEDSYTDSVMSNSDRADMVEDILNKTHINYLWVDVLGDRITVCVEGDWKHDHAYCSKLISNNFNVYDEDELIIGEYDGDYYKSEHIYDVRW